MTHAPPDPPRGAMRLLERVGELSTIAYLVEEASAERAGLGLIEGQAGIGKSRLLAEGRRHAEEKGFRVPAARGRELEREFPSASCASSSSRF